MTPRGRIFTFGMLLWTIFTQEEFPRHKVTLNSYTINMKETPSMENVIPGITTLITRCWDSKDLSLDEVREKLQQLFEFYLH